MKRVKTSLMGRLAQLVRASCWISSRCHDLAEVSGAFWNLSLIYKICSSLYILIGLQRNILYSKPNQHATPFIRHVVLIIQRFWVRPLTLAMLREHLFGPYGCFHLVHHNSFRYNHSRSLPLMKGYALYFSGESKFSSLSRTLFFDI